MSAFLAGLYLCCFFIIKTIFIYGGEPVKQYDRNTVYFISYAKLPENISAGKLHGVVGIGLIINTKTGIIEDAVSTLLTDEAKAFLKSMIVGFNLHENNIDDLTNEISYRFHGVSRKAVCVALKGTYEKYETWKNEVERENFLNR